MSTRRSFLPFVILVGCAKPDGRLAEARQELTSFSKSVRDFRDQKGHWPTNLVEATGETCLGESHKCVGEHGKRLDPWGNAYEYDQSLKSVLLRSSGPDQKMGTRDDLEEFVPGQGSAKK